jgi:hypothetical protein
MNTARHIQHVITKICLALWCRIQDHLRMKSKMVLEMGSSLEFICVTIVMWLVFGTRWNSRTGPCQPQTTSAWRSVSRKTQDSPTNDCAHYRPPPPHTLLPLLLTPTCRLPPATSRARRMDKNSSVSLSR